MRAARILLGRSRSKPPFFDPLRDMGTGDPPIGTRRSTIIPNWIGKKILVHNGRWFCEVNVEADMVGHKLGNFVLTKMPREKVQSDSKAPPKRRIRPRGWSV
mmetsp:Transcript_9387/g.13695  ORF Transcript_9387/g.13695 Transcript_9387/m.13695 type:complete len:102 (-) Transcript_9387:363-668(-)